MDGVERGAAADIERGDEGEHQELHQYGTEDDAAPLHAFDSGRGVEERHMRLIDDALHYARERGCSPPRSALGSRRRGDWTAGPLLRYGHC